MLKISNTLSGKLEEFHPLDEKQVRMYTCGPTVYDYAHIGNFRTFVFQDVLKRYLRFKGYQVFHVMNITDVDDKTIRNSGASNPAQLRAYTDRFTAAFFEDCGKLRILRPDVVAHATDHISEMVTLIQTLNSKGFTYEKEGSVYFRISQFKDYGKLSKLDADGILAGARVDVDEYGKQDARDFVLWKATKNGEPHWETALGPGRPGWHVECSAMSMKYLGETFDLHCGAVDLVFPHHENEIAQSEAATEKPFVRYWVHGEHLLVEGEKMSKSKGNFYTLRDLIQQRQYDPLAVRYMLLSVPYKRKLNFTDDAYRQALSRLARISEVQLNLNACAVKPGKSDDMRAHCLEAERGFEEAMDDDLNTSRALSALFVLVRKVNTDLGKGWIFEVDRSRILEVLQKINKVLDVYTVGELRLDFADTINLKDQVEVNVSPEQSGFLGWESGALVAKDTTSLRLPAAVKQLMESRARVRGSRDFALADQIRDQIHELGYVIEDTKEGIRWKKR